jgi:hypothetical protein
MANYYTKLSFGPRKSDFPLEEIAQIIDAATNDDPDATPTWLLEKHPDFFERHNDHFGVAYTMTERTPTAPFDMIIYGEESANPGFMADVIHAVLEHHGSKDCVGFEYALDCSKPRIDAYGGGACFITANGIEYMSTNLWLEEKAQAFEKTVAEEEEDSSPRP